MPAATEVLKEKSQTKKLMLDTVRWLGYNLIQSPEMEDQMKASGASCGAFLVSGLEAEIEAVAAQQFPSPNGGRTILSRRI
jgi:hypothetical protein